MILKSALTPFVEARHTFVCCTDNCNEYLGEWHADNVCNMPSSGYLLCHLVFEEGEGTAQEPSRTEALHGRKTLQPAETLDDHPA